MKDLVSGGTTAEADALANLAHHAAHTQGAYAPTRNAPCAPTWPASQDGVPIVACPARRGR